MKDLSVQRTTPAPEQQTAGLFLVHRPTGRVAIAVCLIWLLVAASELFAQVRPGEAEKEAPKLPPKLPSGFQPPRTVPKIMKIEKELLTEQQDKALGVELKKAKYANILRAGKLDARTRPIVQKAARWRVYRLSMKKYRRDLPKLRSELYRDIITAAKLQEKPPIARSFREFYLQEITNRAAELLDGNLYVRLNAVLIFEQLNLVEGNPSKVAEEAFTPPADLLLKVVDDKQQPEGIKIPAVKALGRIALKGTPNNDMKLRMAESFIRHLENKEAHPWYQERLVEALGAIDLDLHRTKGTPFIVDALAKTMVDRERRWPVRCQAAMSLGRVPLHAGVNVRPLAFEIVHLARQMVAAYNKNPSMFYWKECFYKAYLGFRAASANAKPANAGLLAKVQTGPLGKYKEITQDSYKHVLSLTKLVLVQSGKQIPKKLTDEIDDWLKKNQPDDFRVFPGLEPIATKKNVEKTLTAVAG